MDGKALGAIGHNSKGATITVEARLFNSLSKYAPDKRAFPKLTLPAGATVGDIIHVLGLPRDRVFLVLKNGRDVTRGLVGAPINLQVAVDDGDVVAFSGPVPYSYGYGAPVV